MTDLDKIAPSTVPGSCAHGHMKFMDGSFLIRCIDCGQAWAAVDDRGISVYTLKGIPIYPPRDTRHDRWEIPRTVKKA